MKTWQPPQRYSQQQNLINATLIKNTLMRAVKAQPQGISPMQQLQLQYDVNDTKDINQLRTILSKILTYPSSQIAQLHMKANRLGDLDLKQNLITGENADFKQISQNAKFCPCCGFILQDNTVGICTNIQQINHMGVSTFLYFHTLKVILVLFTIMFFVFTIYAVISNIISSNSYKNSTSFANLPPNLLSYQGFLVISLGSKQLHQTEQDKTLFKVQCWLGVAMVAIWGILFAVIKHRQRSINREIDIDSKTASDFTILIENFPSQMQQKQLGIVLQKYQQSLGQIFMIEAKTPIRIVKINKAKPFYLDQQSFSGKQLDQINQQYKVFRQKFAQWIKQRIQYSAFSEPDEQRLKIYKKYQQIKAERLEIYKKIANQIKKQKRDEQFKQTVPTFVTFQSSYNKQLLEQLHENSNRIWSCLPCIDKSKYLYFKQGGMQNLAIVKQAPEPEDIIWTNLGQPSSEYYKKRFITFTISLLVLGASFGAIYGLSKVQFDYTKTHNDVSNQYISILISLCISIINIIIQQILRLLTKLQRSSTYTSYQTSLGLKAVVALLINSILIPILVNYFFKQNLYGVNGLAYDVFFLAITNSFLSPLLKIFDLYYYFTRFWRWYKDQPQRKLYMNQNQLNTISEYMEFEIGYQYIYIVNLFLFTCFFCSLQPIIVVFAIAGLFIMYWAQKYSLFNRCKRPTPGNNSINTAMYQLIYLGPAFYTIGSFCWSDFFKQSFIGIAPNLTAAIISLIIFLLPYKSFVKNFFTDEPEAQLLFSENRIYMPSQYDRLNPSTKDVGIQDYLNYLADYKKKNQNNTSKKLQQIQHNFAKQLGLGRRPNYQTIAPRFQNFISFNNNNFFSEDQIIVQQLLGTNKNIFNPALIGNAVLSETNKLKMPTQNWFTSQQQQKLIHFLAPSNQMQSDTRFKMTNSKYMSQNMQTKPKQQMTVNKNGNINFLYQAVANIADAQHQNQGNRIQPANNQTQQIPLNIPFNMFGNLLTNTDQFAESRYQSNKPNLFDQMIDPYKQYNPQNKNQTYNQTPINIELGLMNNMKNNFSNNSNPYYNQNDNFRQPKY